MASPTPTRAPGEGAVTEDHWRTAEWVRAFGAYTRETVARAIAAAEARGRAAGLEEAAKWVLNNSWKRPTLNGAVAAIRALATVTPSEGPEE